MRNMRRCQRKTIPTSSNAQHGSSSLRWQMPFSFELKTVTIQKNAGTPYQNRHLRLVKTIFMHFVPKPFKNAPPRKPKNWRERQISTTATSIAAVEEERNVWGDVELVLLLESLPPEFGQRKAYILANQNITHMEAATPLASNEVQISRENTGTATVNLL